MYLMLYSRIDANFCTVATYLKDELRVKFVGLEDKCSYGFT